MPIVRQAAPAAAVQRLKPQPIWYVTPQGWRVPSPGLSDRLGMTAPRPWIETVYPTYYYPLPLAPKAGQPIIATQPPKPQLVLPSVPTEPLPPSGQFEIQTGTWKVVLTKEEAGAGAEVSLIDRIKAWLAQETIVAGYANQWFVVGGVLAYLVLRKK